MICELGREHISTNAILVLPYTELCLTWEHRILIKITYIQLLKK